MILLNKKSFILMFQLIYWGTRTASTENVIAINHDTKTDETQSSNTPDFNLSNPVDSPDYLKYDNITNTELLDRKKRWITTGFCINYPLCCDIGGKDTCAFFCPVCPIKRDYCKLSILVLYVF